MLHLFGGAFLVDDFLARLFAHTIQPPTDEPVIQRAGNAVDVKAENAQQIAADLKVCIVAGDKDHGLPPLHHPLAGLDVLVGRVLVPVVPFDQPGGKEHIDNEHHNMLEAAPARRLDPRGVPFGETCPEIVNRPLSAATVVLPHGPAEKTCKSQVRLYIEQIHDKDDDAQRGIGKPVENDVALSFFSSFSNRFLVHIGPDNC